MLNMRIDSYKSQDSLVVVEIRPINGQGDLSCGVKVATLLQKRNIPLVLATFQESMEALEVFNKKKFSIISIDQVANLNNVALRIIAPFDDLYSLDGMYAVNIRTLAFFEYGFTPKQLTSPLSEYFTSFSMGFLPRDLGIIIDDNWQTSHRLSKQPCQERFDSLSEDLKQAASEILQEPFDPITTHYFLAYSKIYRYQKLFINDMKKKYATCGKRLVFFVIHNCAMRDLTLKKEENKQNTYIPCVGLDPDLFRALMLLSEECLVTGDQSLGEAISINKKFHYEVCGHKSKFAEQLRQQYTMKGDEVLSCEDDAQYDASNYRVCFSMNAADKIANSVEAALKQPQNYPKWVDLRKESAFFDILEKGKCYLITLDQWIALQIPSENGSGLSLLPALQQFKFEVVIDSVFHFLYVS